MKRLLVALAFLAAGCCRDNVCRATVVANEMHAAGDAAAELVQECDERYKTATTIDEIAALDDQCKPLALTYASIRHSLAELVLAISAAKTGSVVPMLPVLIANAATSIEAMVNEIEGAKEMGK